MGITVGDFDVEAVTVGTVGAARFGGFWSIYRRPYTAGDDAVLEGEAGDYSDALQAQAAAQDAGAREARQLMADKAAEA